MIDTEKIYTSNNYGDFKITKYVNSLEVHIEFLLTGYKLITRSEPVKSGMVKDKLYPNLYGVGFIGDGPHKPQIDGKISKAGTVWRGMIQRCYSHKAQKKWPTYIGCLVCDEWHNFQNFAKWFEVNYIEGFHIDKDINQKGVENKIYSPETCAFVSADENVREARALNHTMIDPSGVVHEIYNMREFCRDKNIWPNHMGSVSAGKSNHHKGWTKA